MVNIIVIIILSIFFEVKASDSNLNDKYYDWDEVARVPNFMSVNFFVIDGKQKKINKKEGVNSWG